MTKNICPKCGGGFTKRRKHQKFCSTKCADATASKKRRLKRAANKQPLPPRVCPRCGGTFVPSRPNRKYCGSQCQVERGSCRPKDTTTVVSLAAPASLDYILSDVIFSGAISDEVARLKATPTKTRAAVRARLNDELATIAVWPSHPAGRLALLLYLLDHPHRPRFRHPHEKVRRGYKLPTGIIVRGGVAR